jgi:hypothetical protein
MSRILSILFLVFIWILSGVNPLFAQSDSNSKKQNQSPARLEDSVKNKILSNQSEEYESIKAVQLGDSLRLLELKNEMLQLGTVNKSKIKTLSDEQERILIKDSLRKVLQKLKIDSLRAIVSGFPVILSEDTLFYVFTKLGSYSPHERAVKITERIYKLSGDYFYSADSLAIVPSDLTIDITYGNETIVSISELDAVWMNSTREKLAEEYKNIIADAIKVYKIQNSWQSTFK